MLIQWFLAVNGHHDYIDHIPALWRDVAKPIHRGEIQGCLLECFSYLLPSLHNSFHNHLWKHFQDQFFLLSFLPLHVLWFLLHAQGKYLSFMIKYWQYCILCMHNILKPYVLFWILIYFTCIDLMAFLDIIPNSGQIVNTTHNVVTPHTWDTKDSCNLSTVKTFTCKSGRKIIGTLYWHWIFCILARFVITRQVILSIPRQSASSKPRSMSSWILQNPRSIFDLLHCRPQFQRFPIFEQC